MINDFKLERHYKCNSKVYYSDGTFKTFVFDDPQQCSSLLDRSLDNSSVVRIELSSHCDVIFDRIPREAVI